MINRADRTPVYYQIVDWITEQINGGAWPPHYKLPAEEALAQKLGVARGTVRQAFRELEEANVIYRLHGKGTFVSSGVIEHKLDGECLSFLEEFTRNRVAFKATVLEKSIVEATPPLRSILGLAEREPVLSVRRVRKVGPDSIMLSENHIACERYPGIEHKDFSNNAIYAVLESEYGVHLTWVKRTFEAKVADADLAKHLDIPAGAPIIFVEQLVYDADNRCIDYAYIWLRGDKIKLSSTIRCNPAK